MIINHQHRFCFFAIPRTASKSVAKLLIEAYGSQGILKRHSSYGEFIAQAKPEERDYFTFTTVRNPMDSVVSEYFKKKSDHRGRFSRGSYRDGRPIAPAALRRYRFIVENDASFAEYFAEFYQEPYRLPRHEETAQKADVVMRYEQLEEDFEKLLKKLNLPLHPLPKINATAGKRGHFLDYYTPEIVPQALSVFTPLMQQWGYSFPEHWPTR
ncbi:MAG: sulfotransferase family 2 domain-containing protein [Bacteroidota bacterium]